VSRYLCADVWCGCCLAVCCCVLQNGAVCYSVVQCNAVCCSVSHCVAVRCSVLQYLRADVWRGRFLVAGHSKIRKELLCCSVLQQCVAAVCCSAS